MAQGVCRSATASQWVMSAAPTFADTKIETSGIEHRKRAQDTLPNKTPPPDMLCYFSRALDESREHILENAWLRYADLRVFVPSNYCTRRAIKHGIRDYEFPNLRLH